ncbi:MAG: MFS transporter [Candidatus Lokiarchaeota archaeon]|nr:MFS transporter [Candidatus Lokiarchaeota archaeon]MBD3342510.1 MFS transporter [Candidatus Lokiarchaeota archaeon]
MSGINEDVGSIDHTHSKKIMGSYSVGEFVYEFTQGILIFMLFFFYEVEVGLASWITGLGLIIYALWDAINDPFIGYICDHPVRFTKKWGRRFPWMLIGYIPMLVFFVLIFSPPAVNAQEQPWIIFGWLVFTLCLFDTFETLFTNNYFGLFPDKFRSNEERVKASGIYVYLGIIGVVLANILPPMIIVFGNVGSYSIMAWISVSISFLCGFLMLPGIKDDKKKVEEYLAGYEEQEKEPFLATLKTALKQKSLIGFLFLFMAWIALTGMVQSSFLYWIRFIAFGSADDVLYIILFFLIGVFIGIPLWYKYYKKTGNNRKTMIYTSIGCIFLTLMLTFILDLVVLFIVIFIWGIAIGGFWVIYIPTYSDVIDESISNTGIRREGFYSGLRRFMSNFSSVISALLFAIVHELTGFVEIADKQTPLANLGILLLFGIIPASIMAVGLIIFWKLYDITPEKSRNIRAKLEQLKL